MVKVKVHLGSGVKQIIDGLSPIEKKVHDLSVDVVKAIANVPNLDKKVLVSLGKDSANKPFFTLDLIHGTGKGYEVGERKPGFRYCIIGFPGDTSMEEIIVTAFVVVDENNEDDVLVHIVREKDDDDEKIVSYIRDYMLFGVVPFSEETKKALH